MKKSFITFSIVLLSLLIPNTAAADGYVTTTVNGIIYNIHYSGSNISAVATYAEVARNDGFSGSANIQSSVTGILEWNESDSEGNVYHRSRSLTETVTSIIESAFRDCSNLTSINIPNSVTTIGPCAFYDCTGLISVSIPNSVTSVNPGTFSGCSSLASINIPNSVTTIGYYAFRDCSSLTSINIPNSVTTLESRVFYNCTNLTSVILPDKITAIEQSTFYGCSSLTNINIPSAVMYIGKSAFRECYALKSIDIPNSVTNIDASAFQNCTGLTEVTIGDSVDSIGTDAFSSCYRLASITIPESVTDIGGQAFEYCYSLSDVTWNARNCTVEHYNSPFNHCPCLKKITIGPNVKSIGDYIFIIYDYLYDNIDTVTCLAKMPPTITDDLFWSHTYSNATLVVPRGSKSKYTQANGWKNFVDCIENKNSTTVFVSGDVDFSGFIDISDVVHMINLVLINQESDLEVGDINGDGVIDVSDIVLLIDMVLNGN